MQNQRPKGVAPILRIQTCHPFSFHFVGLVGISMERYSLILKVDGTLLIALNAGQTIYPLGDIFACRTLLGVINPPKDPLTPSHGNTGWRDRWWHQWQAIDDEWRSFGIEEMEHLHGFIGCLLVHGNYVFFERRWEIRSVKDREIILTVII